MKQSHWGSKCIINEEMGNTSETHKDKVAGDDDDGGARDVSLISAVDPNCGHVR